ncbi:GNAT family N-acetyltransferase [Roseobacter sp. HKCCD9010]|uniref:GNAT family N-acetyltransferase n=1 Tax=unclassified Roseobacter TaxID=196798 RepID=UPI001491869B|nr:MULTISPECIES: GNAT family N-acetyltransferase [unclassified Roseobacter]MBF9050235.1 GNAT family N-acetyltransferase [Rhodobacterales bacterium HKCCD4356]NNV12478.1 GNAT family N-acetyltransferase [Roseobacter sp. HKCCD7357]NNV16057.1 GNAT family N-acetyltransferase [Roseobacter sp. HKCCD8768]NNV25517.1 GNAT family N-acetyltransferase [Roseobacter sp. HKCCD8192]NNV29774.1 GNAT family N-acetyltransferase [Roseobacter sp. HKCCD9061]
MIELHEGVPTPKDYLALCAAAGLSAPHESVVAAGLTNSLYGVTAHHHQEDLIGMARIVGDGAIFFEIVDVAVRPEFQDQGVGRRLMRDVLDWLAQHAHSTAFVTLHANAGSEPFYRSLGFQCREADEPAMFHPDWNRMETRA